MSTARVAANRNVLKKNHLVKYVIKCPLGDFGVCGRAWHDESRSEIMIGKGERQFAWDPQVGRWHQAVNVN
jgi:hypothetical protein